MTKHPHERGTAATRSPRTRWLVFITRGAVMVAVLVGGLAWLAGCATKVTPPVGVVDPVPVLLLDHGHTPSLVIPTDDQQRQVTRYAYGDRRYYAEGHRGFFSGMRALFGSTQGVMGQRVMDGPNDPDHIRRKVRVRTDHIYVIHVERAAVRNLYEHLDGIHTRNRPTLVINPNADLDFVHHPERYTVFHNSNHVTADWLRMLGCDVGMVSISSNWRIETPSGR